MIIKDSKKLNAKVASVMRTYAANGVALHEIVVSAIVNAMAGNAVVLTRIYNGLRSNDKQALKNYVRRIHVAIGLGGETVPDEMTTEELTAAEKAGSVLTLSVKNGVGSFGVRKDTNDQRAAIEALCVKRLDVPDGVNWHYFLNVNNFSELKKFGDADVLSALKAILTKAGGESKSYVSSTSDQMTRFLKETIGKAENIADSDPRVAPAVAPAVAAMSVAELVGERAAAH